MLDIWTELLAADRVATTAPVRLEVLYSARSALDYQRLRDELDALIQIPCGGDEFRRAEGVQGHLAELGGLHHRSVGLSGLLVAAAAEASGVVVWHYNQDFDRIAAVTDQPTRWIAERGTL